MRMAANRAHVVRIEVRCTAEQRLDVLNRVRCEKPDHDQRRSTRVAEKWVYGKSESAFSPVRGLELWNSLRIIIGILRDKM